MIALGPNDYTFPDPEEVEDDDFSGLLAFGGDLSVPRLVSAYCSGIFPWYTDETPILWWSLDPRMILKLPDFRCSKSLQRTIRSGKFQVKIDTCTEQVIRACASTTRKDEDGTWITEDMIQAYCELARWGFVHSFETFLDGKLVGGLYGVCVSDCFCGESMFHHVSDASKVAFAHLVDFCAFHHFRFIDAQQETSHLASLGAKPIPRKLFLEELRKQTLSPIVHLPWKSNCVALLLGCNQGDRVQLLMQAISMINQRIGNVSSNSTLYETEPWGFDAEQKFLNLALVLTTNLPPDQVLKEALQIEDELGRVRPEQVEGKKIYASRTMDIDLIFYNSLKINTDTLVLPHPRMHLRRFVLTPLAEIMPDYIHPQFRKTISQLLADCTDTGEVKPLI